MSAHYVEDKRTGYFWMHDCILDHYAKEIGVYGVAVYALLCRRANSEKNCWPSLNGMAKDLGVSRQTIVTALDKLETEKLIARNQRQEDRRGHVSTVYTLLVPPLVHEVDKPCPSDAPPLVHEVHPKEYTVEGIHNEGGESESNGGDVRYLDDATQEIVKELLGVPNWDKSEAKTISFVADAKNTYPQVDLVTLAKTFAFKVRTGSTKKYKQPSRAFAGWASREKPEPKPRITKTTEHTPEQRERFAQVEQEFEDLRKRQLAEAMRELGYEVDGEVG